MQKNNIKLFNTIGLFTLLGTILFGVIEDSNQIVLISSTVVLIVIIASLLIYLFLTKQKGFKADNLEQDPSSENLKNKIIIFQLEENGEVSETKMDLNSNEKEKPESTEIELKA